MNDQRRCFSNVVQLGVVAVAVLAVGGQWWWLWQSAYPLGVSGEWTWLRIEDHDWWGRVALTIVFSAVYMGFITWAVQWKWRSVACLLLWIFSWLWIAAAVLAGSQMYGVARVPFILFYQRSSGYFTQAQTQATDLRQFLATYETRIRDTNVPENYLHQGTHPPGLTTLYRLMIEVCRTRPQLVAWAEMLQPDDVKSGFQQIQQYQAAEGKQLDPAEMAAIWWIAWLTLTMVSGVVWPLYLLAVKAVSHEAAWWTAALWPLVPAIAVFFPKSDLMFPLLAITMQWLWLESLERESMWRGLIVGGVMFFSLCLTLAFAPIGLILALQWGWCFLRKRNYRAVGGFLTALLIGIAICWSFELNIVGVWIQNLKNHAAFYEHHSRSYWPWLLANPLELWFSLGAVTGLLSAWGFIKGLQRREFNLIIAIAVWAVLWLSGKNMGEAARLWLLLMPLALWGASFAIEQIVSRSRRPVWMALLVLQVAMALSTVLRVDGFHFADVAR